MIVGDWDNLRTGQIDPEQLKALVARAARARTSGAAAIISVDDLPPPRAEGSGLVEKRIAQHAQYKYPTAPSSPLRTLIPIAMLLLIAAAVAAYFVVV